MRKVCSILICVLLVTTVFAGCIGGAQEGNYSEEQGGSIVVDTSSDESKKEASRKESKKEAPKEQVASVAEGIVPTFEILSEHPMACMNDNDAVTVYVDVFGMYVIASERASVEYVEHTAHVLAQYIDNDEDGVPDDMNVLRELVENNYVVPVWDMKAREEFFGKNRGTPCEDDISMAASMYYDEDTWAFGGIEKSNAENGVPGGWDGNLEEVWHVVSNGWYRAYPEYFGDGGDSDATHTSSKLTTAMDTARGGHFQETPRSYPKSAWYAYDDESCTYGCQIHEYFYWILMTNIGALDPALTDKCVYIDAMGLPIINDEWGICTREELEQKDVLAFELFNNYGFNLPTAIPDGSYQS